MDLLLRINSYSSLYTYKLSFRFLIVYDIHNKVFLMMENPIFSEHFSVIFIFEIIIIN